MFENKFIFKNKFLIFVIFLFLLITVFLFSGIDAIGLHGDEAWLGLKGDYYLKAHRIDRPYGMNFYTGILQSYFDFIAFKVLGITLFSLRISGVIFNFLSLVIFTVFMIKKNYIKELMVFLMLFAQSALYLNYAKVAWEVCSFTLFFMTISVFALYKFIYSESKKRVFIYSFLFLLSAFAGTYNHIIFSSILVAGFLSLCFWSFFFDSGKYLFLKRIINILFISLINVLCLYLIMNKAADIIWRKSHFILPAMVIGLIAFESLIIIKIKDFYFKNLIKIKPHKIYNAVTYVLFFLSFMVFLYFHGAVFWKISAQKIVLLRVYSYNIDGVFKYILLVTGTFIFISFTVAAFYNLIKNRDIFTFFVLTYSAVLPIYVQTNSMRYYLILSILIFLYLSFKFPWRIKFLKLSFLAILIINILIIQKIMLGIIYFPEKNVHAYRFKINMTSVETSAHFLPFKPVVNYLKKVKAGNIKTNDRFFIENNFRFYKEVYPELKQYKGTAEVNYDYGKAGTGFILRKIN